MNGTFVQLFGFVALSSDVQMGSVYTVKPYIFKKISLCMCVELWQLHMAYVSVCEGVGESTCICVHYGVPLVQWECTFMATVNLLQLPHRSQRLAH